MLRRADYAIYMAQKEDSFGKDSEASVALGQGKPVIVYVPKLFISEANVDTEATGAMSADDLKRALLLEDAEYARDPDDTVDQEGLHSRLIMVRLRQLPDDLLTQAVQRHWADFDLYNEAARMERADLAPPQQEPPSGATDKSESSAPESAQVKAPAAYRKWLDAVVKEGKPLSPPPWMREALIGVLVAASMRFERRARIFRAVHPLALQVILSSGVLNGILVARSVDSCAVLLRALVHNSLSLKLMNEEQNYLLIETTTGSVVRVISKHQLLRNAFASFYSRALTSNKV